jgi:SAM-dependent methyltransferase
MRKDSVRLEEARVGGPDHPQDFPPFKERHRIFPSVFEDRRHRAILDLAAGVGYVTRRVLEGYPAKVVSHDISPSCLNFLKKTGAPTVAFDIDDNEVGFPFMSEAFDAVISLVTIEHVFFIDEFLQEIRRILRPGGYLYLSTPNYAAPEYAIRPLLFGRSFHDPLSPSSRYEFYAHVRYFTSRTLFEFVAAKGFRLDTVYMALPGASVRYTRLYAASKLKAHAFRGLMRFRHHLLSWKRAAEPVLCFQKNDSGRPHKIRKVLL